tara:strand:+ start:4662 stop:4973 length:312 start_codon:yes stop_codon:yes gene_type:complete
MSKNDTDFKIGEGTDITIPLRNLLSIIGGVAVAVIGYFHIDERIMLLEHEQVRMLDDISANEIWIDEWESDGILPLDVEQNMKIQFLETRLEELDGKIKEQSK